MRPAPQRTGTAYGVPGKMWKAGHHTGIDLLCPTGTPIVAAADGKVLHAGKNSATGWGAAYGTHVIIESKVAGKTYRHLYAHLSKTSVKAGATVRIGQEIGKSGATGNVTGPHLHFEVRVSNYAYGRDVDPKILLDVHAGPVDKMDPASYYLGAVGPHVTWLGQRLVAHGFGGHYTTGPGPTFTKTDQAAVREFQLAQKWKGKDADGFPGRQSLTILAADPKPKPRTVEVVSAIQNMAGNNATGIKTAKARCDRYVDARKATPVHVVNAQETTVVSTVRPRLDSGLKPLGYGRSAGGKGRYCYTRGVKIIAATLLTVPSNLWYRKDDKQAAAVVYEIDGARGLDVSLHLESDLGAAADAIRVKQAVWIASAALDFASKHGVPAGNVMLSGDTNSEGLVLRALEALGWRNAAAGTKYEDVATFIGWDGRAEKRYDYAFVRTADAVVESVAQNASISDHAGLRVRRLLTAA